MRHTGEGIQPIQGHAAITQFWRAAITRTAAARARRGLSHSRCRRMHPLGCAVGAAECVWAVVLYQPSSLSRLSSMPKWWAISWMTVRRTWSATSCSVRQIAEIAWR